MGSWIFTRWTPTRTELSAKLNGPYQYETMFLYNLKLKWNAKKSFQLKIFKRADKNSDGEVSLDEQIDDLEFAFDQVRDNDCELP